MKRSPFFWPSVVLLATIAGSGSAAIIQAIIPIAAPSTSRRGSVAAASGAGIFQLADSTTNPSTGAAACFDVNGSISATGCTANAVTSTSPVTVNTNTTNDQQLMELSLSAGYLNSLGRPFDFFGAGVYTTQTGQTPTLELKIKLCTVSGCGSGTVVSLVDIVTSATTANSPNVSWNLRALATTAATGATGNLEIHGNATADLGNLISTSDTIFTDTNTAVSSNIDLTAALFVDWTIKFSTNAATANIFTQREGVVSPGGSTSGGGGGAPTPTLTTFAGRPSCTTNGALAFFTDSYYSQAFCNGSSYTYSLNGVSMVPPDVAGGFTSANLGTATYDGTRGPGVLVNTSDASFSIKQRLINVPATPYHTIVAFTGQNGITGNTMQGLCLSDGTKLYIFGIFQAGTGAVQQSHSIVIFSMTNATTNSGTPFNGTGTPEWWFNNKPIWLRLGDNATNRTYDYSPDQGVTWVNVFSETSNTFLTPTKVGYCLNGAPATMIALHWAATS